MSYFTAVNQTGLTHYWPFPVVNGSFIDTTISVTLENGYTEYCRVYERPTGLEIYIVITVLITLTVCAAIHIMLDRAQWKALRGDRIDESDEERGRRVREMVIIDSSYDGFKWLKKRLAWEEEMKKKTNTDLEAGEETY